MTIDTPEPAESPATQARVTTPQERKRAFAILFVCQLAVGMGQTLVFAVLPPIARDLGMGEFETTMIYSLSAFLWVLTSAFWGRRSDVMGRKPVILIGLLGFATSTLFFALVVLAGMQHWVSLTLMFPLLMLARAIFGTFGSGNPPAAQAYVADRTTRAERASGVASVGAAFGIGTVVGPGVAAAFSEVHVLAPFFAVSLLAFISALMIWLYLPERTPPKLKLTERQKNRSSLSWRSPTVLPWIIVGVILSLSQSVTMQLVAFYFMDTMHVAGENATQMISVGLMAMAMATIFAQIGLIQRFDLSVQFLLRWGAGIMVLAFILMVFATSYGLLVTSLTLAGLGWGFIRPGLQAGASLTVSPRDQGAVAGYIGSTGATGHILNPLIGIPLYHWHPQTPFIFCIFLMIAIFAFALWHPAMRDLTQPAEDYEDEEEGIGYR
ncbi:MAG: MFS transporter [Parvibaculum sp.]